MAHKAFGQKKVDSGENVAEPITFDLADEKEILCRKAVNGKLLIELVGKVDSGNVKLQSEGILQVFEVCVQVNDGDNPDRYTGKPLERHRAYELQQIEEQNAEITAENEDLEEGEEPEDLIQAGIDPTSSLGRLTRVLDSPDTEIQVDELAELVGWLVEQYTARPTGNAAASRNGPASGKPTSRRARRTQDRTIAKETQRGSSTSSTESSLTSA